MSEDNPFSSGPGGADPGKGKQVSADPIETPNVKEEVAKLQEPAAADPVKTLAAEETIIETPAVDEAIIDIPEPVNPSVNVRPVTASSSGELPPLEMEETSCRTCQFFHYSEESRVDAAEGECRYNAPSPGLDERAQWPFVEWNSWCGQWNSGISNDDMVKMARIVADRMTDRGSFTE